MASMCRSRSSVVVGSAGHGAAGGISGGWGAAAGGLTVRAVMEGPLARSRSTQRPGARRRTASRGRAFMPLQPDLAGGTLFAQGGTPPGFAWLLVILAFAQ